MYSAPNSNYQLVPFQTVDGNSMPQIQFTPVFHPGATFMAPTTPIAPTTNLAPTNNKSTTNFAPTNYSEASHSTVEPMHKAPFYQSTRFD